MGCLVVEKDGGGVITCGKDRSSDGGEEAGLAALQSGGGENATLRWQRHAMVARQATKKRQRRWDAMAQAVVCTWSVAVSTQHTVGVHVPAAATPWHAIIERDQRQQRRDIR